MLIYESYMEIPEEFSAFLDIRLGSILDEYPCGNQIDTLSVFLGKWHTARHPCTLHTRH